MLGCVRGAYRNNPYQSMVAAIILNQDKNCAVQVPAGMGKTFIIILLGHYFRLKNQKAKFAFVFANDMLRE